MGQPTNPATKRAILLSSTIRPSFVEWVERTKKIRETLLVWNERNVMESAPFFDPFDSSFVRRSGRDRRWHRHRRRDSTIEIFISARWIEWIWNSRRLWRIRIDWHAATVARGIQVIKGSGEVRGRVCISTYTRKSRFNERIPSCWMGCLPFEEILVSRMSCVGFLAINQPTQCNGNES